MRQRTQNLSACRSTGRDFDSRSDRYATGFICVVLTPMRGRDVALGAADALHCYMAMVYVFDHVIANELVLGVPLSSPWGLGFAVSSFLCGVCQFLRAWDDRYARKIYAHATDGSRKHRRKLMSFGTFVHALECGFMLFENALFFIFLFGMTSGVRVE